MWRSICLGSLICLAEACSPDSKDSKAQVPGNDEVSTDVALSAGNCSIMPADFRAFHDFASSRPASPVREVRNLIKIRADRSITWNGEEVPQSLLESNLRAVPRFHPIPVTTLDFESGTPCALINEVRELMRRHLECGEKAMCLQGDGRI